MPTFYDSSGKPYQLNQEIGRGGEGIVYFCPNSNDIVAKIYHEPIDSEKEEKLRWMAENGNEQLLKVAAWILDTLHQTPDGKIIGFLMPSVKAKEIHELYSLKSRRVHFPEATWEFLVHTAINIARAFYVLHKNDHIMGDVNHGNCVVLADGTVKLIDCDSYSIKKDNIRYRCDVGVATHLAPELQGKDLGEIERQKTHDNFGLAVMIFQLLFLGRHPFAGNYLGVEDKSLEDCIREYRFAYGNQEITNVKRPPGTLSLNQVSPPLAHLFKQAFFSQQRPEPQEWIEALDDLKDNLTQCSIHVGHHYYNQLTVCPFCEIESKSGLMLFPYISSNNAETENGLNIFTVENLLANIQLPQQNLTLAKANPSQYLPPSPEVIELRNTRNMRVIIAGSAQFIIVVFLTVLGGGCMSFFIGGTIMAIVLMVFHGIDQPIRDAWTRQLDEARKKWQTFEADWENLFNSEKHNRDALIIRGKLSEYQKIQQDKRNFIKRQTEDFRNTQLKSYLEEFHVSNAESMGEDIGKYQQTFKQFSIKTAGDISANRLRSLITIDDETKLKLLDWRAEIESKFEFKDDSKASENLKVDAETRYSAKQREIERIIEKLLGGLRSGSLQWRQNQQRMLGNVDDLRQKLLQTESDYRIVKNDFVLSITLGLITFLVPIFGGILMDSPDSRSVLNDAPYSSNKTYGGAVNKEVDLPPPTPAIVENSKPIVFVDNYTDEEIEEMTLEDRAVACETLYKQALKLVSLKNYKRAEDLLDLAMKFSKDDKNMLFLKAKILYETKKYSESIKFVEKPMTIDSTNEGFRLLLGKNYLQVKRYDEAKEQFDFILERNSISFEAKYNLGLVHKALRNNTLARKTFSEALYIDPNNVEARFEYALMLSRLGEKNLAKEQYELLHKIDESRAEELRKIIGLEPRGGSGIVVGRGSGQ